MTGIPAAEPSVVKLVFTLEIVLLKLLKRLGIPVLCLLFSSLLSGLVVGAGAQPGSDLPEGYYLYLGKELNDSLNKRLKITADGHIHWMPVEGAGQDKEDGGLFSRFRKKPIGANNQTETNGQATGSSGTKSDGSDNCDSLIAENRYPFIKWRTVPVSGSYSDDSVCQLTTTMEKMGVIYTERMKVSIVLAKLPRFPSVVEVNLLDKDGFKIFQFAIRGDCFHHIPGNDAIEAKETINCDENIYRKAKQYAVIVR